MKKSIQLKYPYYLILLAIAALSFNGCRKLDREFVTDISKDQIDLSYTNVGQEINAIYSDIPDGTAAIGGAAMLASASDEAEHTQENNSVQQFNTGSWNAISNPDNVWGTYYRAIRRANEFISSSTRVNLDIYKLDPAPSQQLLYSTRVAEINRWRYEARFLRAYYTFELLKRYGGVPIVKTALSIDEATNIKRNTFADCVKFISDECDSAATQLPLTYSSTDLGRATKGAALALKSRVLLYAASDLYNTPTWAAGYSNPELIAMPAGDRNARWKAAADAAKAVIDLGGTGYAFNAGGAAGYKSLFNSFTSNETIFVRRNGQSNTFEKNNYPISFDGAGGTTPTQDMVDAYENTDGSKFDWSNATMAASPYLNRDPRLAYSIIYNNSPLNGNPKRIPPNVEIWYGGRDGKPNVNATKTGYYIRKYLYENSALSLSTSLAVHSWIIMRLPELYLNYAEALNEYSVGNPDIKKYVDLVRTRVGMPGISATLSQSQMRDKIRNEDRVEFAFEDHRLWDLRRWMLAPTVLATAIRGVNITQTGSTTFSYVPFTVENRNFDQKMYFYPIPQDDINTDKGLVQNPQW